MNQKIFKIAVFLISAISALPGYAEKEENEPTVKKVAIFTANRVEEKLNDQLPIFEDMIIAQITDLGFEVISQEVVLNAVEKLKKTPKKSKTEKMLGALGDLLKDPKKKELDTILNNQTSALRLSQSLGADYLFFATIMGLDEENRHVNARGIEFDNFTYTLRASYRILDGNTGASLTADMVESDRTIQQTKYSQTTTTGIIRELLADASKQMSASLEKRNNAGNIRKVDVAKSQVEFGIIVGLSDVNFPQAEIDNEGNVTIIANKGIVQPMAVPIELDGFLIGTTGSGEMITQLKAAPGLHRIRLVRDDLIPFERMVNIYEGMTLNITMQLNDAGHARWKENTATYNQLIKQAKLNDAEVEKLRGEAQKLRQSGFKIDYKVDTDEGITIKKNQSIMNQD